MPMSVACTKVIDDMVDDGPLANGKDSKSEEESIVSSSSSSIPTWINNCIEQGIPVSLDELKNPLVRKSAGASEGEELPTPAALRWEFIRSDLKKKALQFSLLHSLKLWIGSWNVNGQELGEDLTAWFQVGEEAPDIAFIGLQEMDRRPEAYVMAVSAKEAAWSTYLLSVLHRAYPEEKYSLIVSKSLVGIYAAMFVKEKLGERVSAVSTMTAGCGLMGMMGNKGGVGLRAKIDSDYVCFISSHLAPHVENVERRNQDYADLCRRLIFPLPTKRRRAETVSEELVLTWNDPSAPATIWDSAFVFWAGDLNYRIAMPLAETRNLALSGEHLTMLEHDQLALEKEAGRVFKEFQEGQIAFPPTYKYVQGSDAFDPRPEGRAPAWTDRILYRGDNERIKLTRYSAAMAVKSSDHKPVSGCFEASFTCIDRQAFDVALTETLRQVDIFENEAMPITTVSSNVLNFGQLVYQRAMMMPVEILNTGQTVARFQFLPKNGKKHISEPWLHVQPRRGIVMPGSSAEIRVYVSVEKGSAIAMNRRLAKPEDILILHVDGGRDHFISVEGTFRPTVFCRSLEELYEASVPCTLPHALSGELRQFEGIPKPVATMVEFLIKHGLDTENLFLESGQIELSRKIQDCLDADQPLSESLCSKMGIQSVAESLLMFLESLVQPVIPSGLYEQCIDSAYRADTSAKTIEQLPQLHRALFDYLTHFLRHQLLPVNKTLRPEELAVVFAKVLLKPHAGPSNKRARLLAQRQDKSTTFLRMFLEPVPDAGIVQ